MKTIHLLIALLLFTTIPACEADNTTAPEVPVSSDNGVLSEAAELEAMVQEINAMEVADLSQDVLDGLILMREEEKLARDVYLHLYDVHGLSVFQNIAQSETRHMSAIKTLFDRYGIPDPVQSDVRGVFSDQHLADLYAQLTAAGEKSMIDALIVGATIEDLDIKDLMNFSEEVEAEDVLLVYSNLTRGSRNHLGAFYAQIQQNGGSYAPLFISQELFDDIISSSNERGGWRGRR